MGLDIYFHKSQSTSNDFNVANEVDTERVQKQFSKAYDRMVKKMGKVAESTYFDTYVAEMKKLMKYPNYPQFDLADMGLSYDWGSCAYSYKPLSVDELVSVKDKVLKNISPRYDAYFRKVNFIYAFFNDKIDHDFESAWAEVDDLEELISRCNEVLKDHSKAEELLPTQSGFFFGGLDYDDWYFDDVKDCKKQMQKLLKGLKENERVYIHFSW